ncbi:hypothetical protein SAMN05661096_02008 [Marivirga sericea]|uniref:Uncharacterized protein n=1 Tax=Marivirga sericea TaxID=1028 RepID=A0A1X7JS08_9BACT|nr:hypothetical protein [Marivirga sericea]SMG30800.1 hypothetical protein SAMN05661096_02008 [Marivirga sericea]
MKKGIIVGCLTGLSFIIFQCIFIYFNFSSPVWSLLILYIALAPVSLLIYKYKIDNNLSMDLALLVASSAYVTLISLFLLALTTIADYTISMIAGVSFFSLLFGFILSAISASLIVKK